MSDPMTKPTCTTTLSPPPSSTTVPLLHRPPPLSRTKSSMHDELRSFRLALRWCALDHSSPVGKAVSYAVFLLLALISPLLVSLSVHAPTNTAIHRLVQLPTTAVATIAFLTHASFFRRYGLRHLLFLDTALRDDPASVRRAHVRELDRAFRYLACILLPCFSVELAHKAAFFSRVAVSVPILGATSQAPFPCKALVFFLSLWSWVYRTGVFLLVCVLFRLTCDLQILRLEGFRSALEGSATDAGGLFREHLRIRKQLLVTSHRYRAFMIGCLVTITVSQLGGLMLVLVFENEKNFINSGDLVVCSAVQLSGFFMCLLGAARITHRAQGVVSIATRWHMVMTAFIPGSLATKNDGHAFPATNSQTTEAHVAVEVPLQEHYTAVESRKSLVMYLQHNNGGITLFGFALDRGHLHALFAFEMTLVLWILSKVVVLS